MAGKSNAAAENIPDDIAGLSFEEALGELEAIVRQLETGDAKLDDAIGKYERGTALKRHCEKKLRDAELKIEKIVKQGDGGLSTAPAEIE